MADGGGFKMPDIGGLMEAAQKMQREMERVQGELAGKTVEASAGGGMVTVVANGRMELVSIKIDLAVVDPKDVQMLQDLVTAAANQALAKARDLAASEMGRIAGGGLPGLPMF